MMGGENNTYEYYDQVIKALNKENYDISCKFIDEHNKLRKAKRWNQAIMFFLCAFLALTIVTMAAGKYAADQYSTQTEALKQELEICTLHKITKTN